MTVKFDQMLAEGLGLSEEVRTQISEAWNQKLSEARDEITAELREEFAQKFEHDKATMVKSMDKFLSEKVQAELEEFAQDKKALAEDRVKYKTAVAKHIKMLETFVAQKLAQEVKELREDRTRASKNVHKLEEFVLQQLAEEIKEFHADKQALVEQRVKLVRENKKTLAESKKAFIKKAASVIEENVNRVIQSEIKQYRDDIELARKNDFGRRIFEAFAGEYMTSYLNESGEVKKLQTQIAELATKLDEAKEQAEEKAKLVESYESKLRVAKDRIGRDKVMTELLAPLSKRQRAVMEELLQNVKTANLQEGYRKYLPAVLNESTPHKTETKKEALKESVRTAKTGDRAPNPSQVEEDADLEIEINQLRKLAGINGQK